MSGCYGDSQEDRYLAGVLDKHLNKLAQRDALAERQDAMANDLYLAKLAALPTLEVAFAGMPYQKRVAKLWDVLQEINGDGLEPLARAVVAKNELEAGREFIRLVTAKLREQAQEEAEEICNVE